MKRLVIILLAVLIWQQAAAQTGTTVTGLLKEKSSELPLEYATVALHRVETQKMLTGATTAHDTIEVAGNYNHRRFQRNERVESTTEDTNHELTDSTSVADLVNKNPYKFKPVQLIVPATLIGVSIIGLESDWIKYQNHEIRDELQENINKRIPIDNFSQYVPMVSVYALNLFGIRGKHDFVDRTIILGTAYALMGITSISMKAITKVERPDGSSPNSFPSGHTATAFMGAEFLRREYWDVSPWIGVAGYAVAAGTGFFRMYNNRHWLTDVVASAGIGILSVQAAYWLYPMISKTFFHKQYLKNVYLSPYASSQEKGLSCRIIF